MFSFQIELNIKGKMRLFYAFTLVTSVFGSIENKCPMRILPEFCNDKADPRCTTKYYYGPSGLSNAERYPSEPRHINLDITYADNDYQILNLTWKPPNDSSIFYLLGYDIGIPGMVWSTYLYDLRKTHFTLNDTETLFSFACKVKKKQHLAICLYSLPISKNNRFHCTQSYRPPTTVTEKTQTFTFNPASPVHVPHESRNHIMLWFIFLGLGIFVLTIIIFALFLLKNYLFRPISIEDELQRINNKNELSSEEEDGEV